jgi:NAD(P)-dependent dehydrogenase (short-subunit alcohol dehydrogenase family)
VNNAGIYKNALLQEMSADEYRQILETNLVAPIMMTRRIFPILQRKRSGVIVNINSLAGKNPTHGESAYCASKHGLRGFAKSIQFEAIKDNVDVIEVYLGTMNTGMVQGRREPDKCIQTKEAAESIYNLCLQHESLRLIESEFSRRLY